MNIRIGEEIIARTNSEFLNIAFGTNHKLYLRSIYNLSSDSVVWMIRIDSTERKGFKNYYEGHYIVEYSKAGETRTQKPYRHIFKIIEEYGKRKYIYLGKYKIDNEKSTKERRYFKLVA